MNKFIFYFRKFSSYILFVFTFLSFLFTGNDILLLIFVSIAFLAFFKINFLELLKHKRYVSRLELFFSVLLFIRIYLLFDINIYFKVMFYVLGCFFLIAYFVSFSNLEGVPTNFLGLKRGSKDKDFSQDDFDEDSDVSEEDFEDQEDTSDVSEEDFEEQEDTSDDLEEDFEEQENTTGDSEEDFEN